VLKLGNDVEAIYPNSDNTLFVIAYATKPGELRRTADGSLVQTLSDDVSSMSVIPGPRAAFFVVGHDDNTSELWTTEDKPRRLSQSGLGLDTSFFEMNSQRLILPYSDDQAYILDLALLSAVGGDPGALSPEELAGIACEQLFQPGKFDETQLGAVFGGAGGAGVWVKGCQRIRGSD
jgi:hypothetical protein